MCAPQEGEHAYIRLNFNFGGAYEPSTRHPAAIFLKELSFRTADPRHAAKVVQEIKALRSAVQQREKEKAERATLVQQEKLVRGKVRWGGVARQAARASLLCWRAPQARQPQRLSRARALCHPPTGTTGLLAPQGRVYALPDVWIRPAFGGKGRKVTGTLEAHANGFRYTSPKGEELDIMYR